MCIRDSVYYIHISDEEMINQYERLIRSNKVLFVLLDKNENQHWQALARNATRIQFAIIATIKLPARHNGEPIDFYLARLECVKKWNGSLIDILICFDEALAGLSICSAKNSIWARQAKPR